MRGKHWEEFGSIPLQVDLTYIVVFSFPVSAVFIFILGI